MQLTKIELEMLKDTVSASTHACAVCSQPCAIRFAEGCAQCPRFVAYETMRDKVVEIRDTDTVRT